MDWLDGLVMSHYTIVSEELSFPFLIVCIVDSGHRGIIYNRIGGIQNKVIPEGTHFLVPWFQRVYRYDIRTQPRTMSSLTGTRGNRREGVVLG